MNPTALACWAPGRTLTATKTANVARLGDVLLATGASKEHPELLNILHGHTALVQVVTVTATPGDNQSDRSVAVDGTSNSVPDGYKSSR